jgi:hypothetical protein
MKHHIKVFAFSLIYLLASCNSEIHLLTHQDNKMEFTLNKITGVWASQFDRETIFQELISYSKDTTLLTKPDLFFKHPISVNRTNRKGKKNGLWITGSCNYFEINNYKNDSLHGKSISYLHGNESIECKYKNGKLNGKYEKKLGEYTVKRIHYKNGKVTKLEILNPKW